MKTGTGKFYGGTRYIVATDDEKQWMAFRNEAHRQTFIDAGTPWDKPQRFSAAGWSTDQYGSDKIPDTYGEPTWDEEPVFKVGDRVRIKHTESRERYRGKEFVITKIDRPAQKGAWRPYAIGDDVEYPDRLLFSGGVFLDNLEHVIEPQFSLIYVQSKASGSYFNAVTNSQDPTRYYTGTIPLEHRLAEAPDEWESWAKRGILQDAHRFDIILPAKKETYWEKEYYDLTEALAAKAKAMNWCGEWDEFKRANNVRMREPEFPFPTVPGTVVDVYTVTGTFMSRWVRGEGHWRSSFTGTTRTDEEVKNMVGGGRTYKVTEVPA